VTQAEFKLDAFRFRSLFWSPWEQYKDRIGEPFVPLSVQTLTEIDPDNPAPLFRIRLSDGTEIDAWEEEVVHPSTILLTGLDGLSSLERHPPSDEAIARKDGAL
jgi:hypothetical protein